MWSFCEWKLPAVIAGQPSTNNELISRAEQRGSNSQRKKKKYFSRNVTMHSEPPLDNHDPQCRLQMATSPCWWPIVTGGSRNPPSAKSLPRRQFNQRLRQENRTEDNGDGSQVEGGCEHWHTTCAHHFARAIYLLHLLPPFFVHMWWQRTCSLAGLAWDVSAASRKRTVVLCMNKTLFSTVQSCVCLCGFRKRRKST